MSNVKTALKSGTFNHTEDGSIAVGYGVSSDKRADIMNNQMSKIMEHESKNKDEFYMCRIIERCSNEVAKNEAEKHYCIFQVGYAIKAMEVENENPFEALFSAKN